MTTLILNTTTEYNISGNTGNYGINEIKEYAEDVTDTIKRKVVFAMFDANGKSLDITLGGDIDINSGDIDFDDELVTHGHDLSNDDYEFVFDTLKAPLAELLKQEVIKPISTDFDYNYHNSEKHSSSKVSEYVRHNLDVYNEFMGMSAVYQNGQSYIHGDHSTPSTKVELSDLGGTDPKLLKLNELYAEDFESEDYVKYMQELIEELALDDVKTIADLHKVYIDLMDNNSRAQQYAENLDIEPVFIDFD